MRLVVIPPSPSRAVAHRAPLRGPTLSELALELARVGARVSGDGSLRVADLRQDSRRISRGELFAARAGARTSGAEHAVDAVQRGAAALLVERGTSLPELGVPVLEVDDVRLAIALAAEAIHGHPSRSLGVVGITGTNGKTTSSFLTQHAIDSGGGRAGRLGTLGFDFESERVESPLTTPEADEISRFARLVRDRGGTHLVMEASSHALSQARVEAQSFAVAAFTNLTQDHLDFHGTMQAYADAKLRLFTELEPRASVVNVDDPFGRTIAERARGHLLAVSRSGQGDVRPVDVRLDARGIRGTIVLPSGSVELETRLVGAHNLDNLLLALAIVEALSLDVARAARGFSRAPAVPGRLERCDVPADDLIVLVDYAHTPDALERALAAVRPLTSGRVICVFGCGGDRDPGKRPRMGDAVGRGADRAIVTNDNPRSEDPRAIADAILPGLSPHAIEQEVELDRALAIERAVAEAQAGDVVLIAGKGHEPYQLIGAEIRRFDDRVEARRALARRRERLGR
jgi:UDP-N-acetylmuramoyl-L-alanyl-D-glutamate--2,6-diaminopimelate ligase